MHLSICTVPVAPMRKDPAHRSEMVSQLLFGEYAEVLSSADGFVRIKCLYDNYEGWCQANQLQETGDENVNEPTGFATGYLNELVFNGATMQVPFGSPMYSRHCFSAPGRGLDIDCLDTVKTSPHHQPTLSASAMQVIAFRFLNTGYLWGGKSVFGIDCSGFTQQVYKFFGVALLRDAYLQQAQGDAVGNVAASVAGDLAFFQNETGRVTHVGIVLDQGEIIHASGRVRIDKLDEEGILTEGGERTHRMHSLRRLVNPFQAASCYQ